MSANFNSLTPFPEIGDESFDVVILTQVIEHIPNCPLGFLTEIARITKPGGLLVVTTPQLASVMNAFRLLLGHGSIWRTDEPLSGGRGFELLSGRPASPKTYHPFRAVRLTRHVGLRGGIPRKRACERRQAPRDLGVGFRLSHQDLLGRSLRSVDGEVTVPCPP
ncbi:MAG: class I SAM-dependent methyltransferase [Blastocatellia bacterium]|nr:class I SAM-dependent methyltransferase [Blastocatellia bacterium]